LDEYRFGLRFEIQRNCGSSCVHGSDEQKAVPRIFETTLIAGVEERRCCCDGSFEFTQRSDVETLLATKGATALYLSAYRPDLNPMELSFAKLKSVLRKLKIRDINKLKQFLQRSPKLFSKNECKNYVKHAGYIV
jgi:hypothetical protein